MHLRLEFLDQLVELEQRHYAGVGRPTRPEIGCRLRPLGRKATGR